MKPRGVIFDCDGVLFESHRANLAYYNRIFERFGYPLITDPESTDAHVCHTASSPVVIAKLMSEVAVDEAIKYAATIDYREFIPLMIEAEDLKPSLKRLSEQLPLAVATNRGSSMQEVLQHFGLAHHFSSVVTSRDVSAPKPAPDMLLLAAEKLKLPVADCLFVGDSELDRQAAESAGMRFVGYGENVSAEQRVNTHTELSDLVLKGKC